MASRPKACGSEAGAVAGSDALAEQLLEWRRTSSLPNLADLVNDRSVHSTPSDSSSDDNMAMHVSHDTFLEASRSMERLQMELENREQVIRELVDLRSRDKIEFEAQLGRMQSELMAERARARALLSRYEQEQQLQRQRSGSASGRAGGVVTGGITVLNANAWNNDKPGPGCFDATMLLSDDFMI